MYVTTYTWNLKETNEYNKNRDTHRYRELVIAIERGKGRTGKGEQIKRYPLTMHKTNQVQRSIVQHREHSQYHMITIMEHHL